MKANKLEIPGKYIFELSKDNSTYHIKPYTKEKNNLTIKDLQTKLEKENFVLLNEDQWEYACGQGSRTLFRWGNTQIPNCWAQTGADWKSVPNNFGLHIATNPYERELINSTTHTKGGDAGKTYNSLGEFNHLRFFITFPLATYYRNPFTPIQNLIKNKYTPPYVYRRAIVL